MHNRRGSLQGRNTKDKVKQEIVRLGVTYGLVSRETSYVAVEERENPETGEMTFRKIPIALKQGWGGMEMSAGLTACMAAPPSPDLMMSRDYGGHVVSARAREAAPAPALPFRKEPSEGVMFSARPVGRPTRPLPQGFTRAGASRWLLEEK